MNVKQDIRNELFKRQELVIELEGEKNPSFEETRKLISEHCKKPVENIDVYEIQGKFGKKIFEIGVYIYETKEELEIMKNLRKTQKQRKADAEAKKAEEESKQESKESAGEQPVADEKPAEEKSAEQSEEVKEEKPAEEVKEGSAEGNKEEKVEDKPQEKPAE